MTPSQFRATFVDGNIAEFRAATHDLRRAANAVWAVDALVAHIHQWAKSNAPAKITAGTDKQYRHTLAQKCKPYKILRQAADAMKHAWLGDKKADLKRSDDIKNIGRAFQADAFSTAFQLGEAVVVLRDGSSYPVADLIDASIVMLEGEIARLGE